MRIPVGAAMLLALAACSQEQAPSDKLRNAATELVEQATGTEPPKLADGPWAPRDECAELPGAAAFRESLANAVEARDVDALAALSASDIKLDFGGGSGTGELRARLLNPERSLWDELDDLLALGCAANGQGGLTIPWYFTQDMGDVDPFEGMIVTGEHVPLRAAPDPKADALAEISWDLVTLEGGLHPEERYQKVATADGRKGYIATAKLRSLVDFRLVASSRNGKWSITSLVAGD